MDRSASPFARLSDAMRQGGEFVRNHRGFAVMVAVGGVVYSIVCVLIGMPPVVVVGLPMAIVALTIASTWFQFRRARKSDNGDRRALAPANLLIHVGFATMVVLVVAQAVPYGRDHSNPPMTGEPNWASPETRELMVRACYSCHSNEVDRPWYSNVAPISWMVQAHIDEGRAEVNYSEFATNPRGADETLEVILDGSMPPSYFTRFGLHSEANLTDDELARLIAGVRATPGLTERDEDGEDD